MQVGGQLTHRTYPVQPAFRPLLLPDHRRGRKGDPTRPTHLQRALLLGLRRSHRLSPNAVAAWGWSATSHRMVGGPADARPGRRALCGCDIQELGTPLIWSVNKVELLIRGLPGIELSFPMCARSFCFQIAEQVLPPRDRGPWSFHRTAPSFTSA